MRNSHLNAGITLCHISERRERASDRLEMPDQMSNAVQIFRDRTILGMRKFPMKRFCNSVVARDTRTLISTSNLCSLRRMISPLRAIRTVRARTNHHLFSSKILPLSTTGARGSQVFLRRTSVNASLTSQERIRSAPRLPFRPRTLSDSREFTLLDDMSIKEKKEASFKTWNRYQTKWNLIKGKGTAGS